MDNEGLKKLARGVLADAYVMSLGTADEGGAWVADLIYVADEDFNLYWISFPQRAGEILENGHVWYRLRPTKVELIHSEPFGYEKKIVALG